MKAAVVIAFTLVVSGALYIRLRWHRSPRAFRAMIALSAGYFVAGSIAGAWILHLASPRHAETQSASANVTPPASRPAVSSD